MTIEGRLFKVNSMRQKLSMPENPDVIASLQRFPNPNAIWSAYRAELINQETVFRLLPNDRPSRLDLFLETLGDVLRIPRDENY